MSEYRKMKLLGHSTHTLKERCIIINNLSVDTHYLGFEHIQLANLRISEYYMTLI
jgi:hypothetical protein